MQFATFDVIYHNPSGEEERTVTFRPVPLSKLNEVKILQEKLIEKFIEFNCSLANILTDKITWGLVKDLATKIPSINGDVGIDVEKLAESGNLVQLGRIFFTESIEPEMKAKGISEHDGKYYDANHKTTIPLPSSISRIHDMDFFKIYQTIQMEAWEENIAKEAKETIEREKAIIMEAQIETSKEKTTVKNSTKPVEMSSAT